MHPTSFPCISPAVQMTDHKIKKQFHSLCHIYMMWSAKISVIHPFKENENCRYLLLLLSIAAYGIYLYDTVVRYTASGPSHTIFWITVRQRYTVDKLLSESSSFLCSAVLHNVLKSLVLEFSQAPGMEIQCYHSTLTD